MDKRPTFIIVDTGRQENSDDEYRGLTEQELDEIFNKDSTEQPSDD